MTVATACYEKKKPPQVHEGTMGQSEADSYLPPKGSKKRKAGVGDVYEVCLPKCCRYHQVCHVDLRRGRGATLPVVRVLDFRSNRLCNNIDELDGCSEAYYTGLINSGARNRAKWSTRLGTLPLPSCWRDTPSFKSKLPIPDASGSWKWRVPIEAGWKVKDSKDLTRVERALPSDEFLSRELFVVRLATQWAPEQEANERFGEIPCVESEFTKKFPKCVKCLEDQILEWRSLYE
ncbi:MAG: hypothetical protein Aurels2KO_44600 [Aureliella sp.]